MYKAYIRCIYKGYRRVIHESYKGRVRVWKGQIWVPYDENICFDNAQLDFNNDFVFDLDELVVDNYVIAAGSAAGSFSETIPLTIPAGDLTGSFNLSTLVDDIDEENETFTITLSNPSQASIGAQSTTTITITDNDNPPTIFVGSLA